MKMFETILKTIAIIAGILHSIYMIILPFTTEVTIFKKIVGVALALFIGSPLTICLYMAIATAIIMLIHKIADRF